MYMIICILMTIILPYVVVVASFVAHNITMCTSFGQTDSLVVTVAVHHVHTYMITA